MWDQPSQFAWNQLNNYQNTVNGNYGVTEILLVGNAAMGMLGAEFLVEWWKCVSWGWFYGMMLQLPGFCL